MPRPETNSSTIANTYLNKKFEGDKARFQLFEAEVKMALLSEIGEYGVNFLTTDWPIDPATNKPVYDNRYKMKQILEPLETGNPEVKRERRELIAFNEKHNDKVELCKRTCTKVISDRVTPALNQHLLLLDGDSYLFWMYLKRTYGDQLITAQGIGSIFINLIAKSMEHEQRFNEFILDFERTANLVKLPDNVKLGLLLTDGDNKMKIRMLPERLQNAVERCKLDAKSYEDTKIYIMEKDDIMHTEGIKRDKHEKHINTVTDKSCLNCNNFFHMAHQCLLNACGLCQKFNCGHKANECRNNHANATSGQTGGRGTGNGGRGTGNGGRGRGSSRGRGNSSSGIINNRRVDNNSNNSSNRFPNSSNSDNNHSFGHNNSNPNSNYNRPNNNKKNQNNHQNNYNRNNNNKRQRLITSMENDDDDDYNSDNDAFNQWTSRMKDNQMPSYDDDDDDFYDDEIDYPIRQRIIKRVNNDSVFTQPSIKKIAVLTSSKDEPQKPIIMLADSGAQEFCVYDKDYLTCDVENYDHSHKPSVRLAGAGGDILPIAAKGTINDVIKDVYVCEKLDTNILSTNKLRDQGYWFIQPPTSISPDHAGYFFDSNGKLSLICDQSLLTDVVKMNTYDYTINLPDISTINEKSSTIYNIYGAEKMNIQEMIDFLAESYLLNVNDLTFLTIGMDNFPATSTQIRKYYKTPICLTRGTMQSRNKHQKYFDTTETSEKHPTLTKDSNPNKNLERRNLNIGTIVGTDVFGPISNKCASLFVDKATGFVKSSFYKWSNKKQISEKENETIKDIEVFKSIEWCIDIYKMYGHSISTLQSDSINIYKSDKVKSLCIKNGILQDHSPVGQHSHNGLAEITIKIISNKVTAMLCLAPYFPIQHWTRAWELAEIINNVRCSRIPGSNITRWEEFTHEKPNYKNMTILPFGQPIEYLLPVSMRSGKLTEHSRLGMYCGPDLSAGNKGSIILWNPKTLRFISQSTYKILPRNRTPYEWKPLDPGNFIRNKPEDNVDHSKIVSHESDTNIHELPNQTNTESVLITPNLPNVNVDNSEKPPNPTPILSTPELQLSTSEGESAKESTENTNSEGVKDTNSEIIDTSIKTNTIPSTTDTTNGTIPGNRNRGNWKDGPVKFRSTILSEGVSPTVVPTVELGKNVVDTNKIISKVKSKHRDYDNPTVKQAMQRDDWPLWEAAINEEYNQMFDDKVFQNVSKIEKGANIIGSMFTLTIKRDPTTGQIEKYKARLVALGNQQKPDSYKDISSQTVRSASVKTLLAIQAKTNAYSMVLDVKGAYLKSQIDEIKKEKLYLKLPDGNIVKLQKYLYGLKQAGLEWQKNVTRTLKQYGYLPTIDPMIFYKRVANNFIMMSLHVDDFYVISTSQKMLDRLYEILITNYKEITKKSGDLLTYLGITIIKNDDNTITITQPSLVNKIITTSNMNDCKGISTPMSTTQTYNDKFNDTSVDRTYYLKLVGQINYLASYTRPDLLYSLSRVSQSCSNPTEADMIRVKRIIRHISETKDYGITYDVSPDYYVYCHVDASFNCYIDGKGHYGYTISIGKNNGSIYAKSSKMKIIALSSTEAEYVALCFAAAEVIFLRELMKQLGFISDRPSIIYEDNLSCIKMIYGQLRHHTTKHINTRYHFTKDQVQKNNVQIIHCKTEEMIADILTKPLPTDQHIYLAGKLLNISI